MARKFISWMRVPRQFQRLFFLLFFYLFILGCSGSSPGELNPSSAKRADFKNVFQVTPEDSKKWSLPATSFTLSYPDEVSALLPQLGQRNSNYIEFTAKQNGQAAESLALGYFEYRITETAYEKFAAILLEDFLRNLRSDYPDLELIYKGKAFLNGIEIHQLQLYVTVKTNQQGEPGKYKMLIGLIPPPTARESDGAKRILCNGVIAIFQTREPSETIRTFSDFGWKGITGKIWQTFRFNDACLAGSPLPRMKRQ